jgi:hypothetical protein
VFCQAANLQDLRTILVELDKEEKACGPQMLEIMRQWSADATESQNRQEPSRGEDEVCKKKKASEGTSYLGKGDLIYR